MSILGALRTQRGRQVAFVSLSTLFILWCHHVTTRPPKYVRKLFEPERYAPGSQKQIQLFTRAADVAGVSSDWASDPGLIALIEAESAGWVGIPNYTYGERKKDRSRWPGVWAELRRGAITTKSSATGLGQLKLSNVDVFYPAGRAGIGDALNEAVGMLRYIDVRYGHPREAWRCHDRLCDDIPGKRPKTFEEGY